MKHLAILTFFAAAAAWGQNAPKLNARELFYSAPQATNTTNTAANSSTAQAGTNTAANTGSTNTTTSNANKKQTNAKTGSSRPTGSNSSGNSSTAVAQSGGQTSGQATSNQTTGNQSTTQSSGGAHILAASSTTGPLGLRYSVLKRDANGAFREIDPDTSFRTGDAIRLQVESNSTGYLYVVTQGTSGQWQLLFPRPDVAGGSNRVEPHDKIEVPGNRGVWKFDEHAGTEKLFLVLARQPEPDLDKLIYAIGGAGGGNSGSRETLVAQASIRDDVVSRMRNQVLSRDLVFEKVDEGASGNAPVQHENAAYVVNVSTAPDARVVKDFALQHK